MKMCINLFILTLKRLIRLYYYAKGMFVKGDAIMFLPHSTMCKYDKYDIINYRSDNAYTFFNYLVSNGLQKDKRIYVVVSDLTDIQRLEEYVKIRLSDYRIEFIDYFRDKKYSLWENLRNEITQGRAISESSYIISSSTYTIFDNLISYQKFIDLSYYSVPFKNDILNRDSPIYMGLDRVGKKVYRYVASSELSIRLILPTMVIPYENYVNLGMCRNDNLLLPYDITSLRIHLCKDLSYQVEKIILYTPTHKDYEQNAQGISHSLMGIDLDLNEFDNFLKENGVLIICKVHPKQNISVISKLLPESIRLHVGNENYGLTELMLVSDALMTDYTSGYFDYLLLDKPVVFNFYDFDVYKKTRGFTYDPLESILAGEVIKDKADLWAALANLDANAKVFKEKRHFVRDLFFTNQDTGNCRRVYDYFFNGI